MQSSWIPVLVVPQNIFQLLCLGFLSITALPMEHATTSLITSVDRQQFPKQGNADQPRHDNRQQFPTQRRGSGTHWQIQVPTLDT